MEIRVLRYFLAVARAGTVSGAAEALHISQPTLSRQLMDLEDELGKQLFTRGNRRITLTEEGMFLRKRAEEIIDLLDKTEAEIASSNDIISGEICIGAGETDAMRLIAHVAKSIQNDHPDIKYSIFSSNAEGVTEHIDKGLIDFGVLLHPTDMSKYEYLKLPATDTWGILMRKDSELAQNEKISSRDIWGKPLICPRQITLSDEIVRWFKKPFEQLRIVAEYNLLFNASILVEEGLGYALCLDKLIKTPDDGILCFKPLTPSLEVHLYIVWKKYQVFSKAADLFLKKLHESFDETE